MNFNNYLYYIIYLAKIVSFLMIFAFYILPLYTISNSFNTSPHSGTLLVQFFVTFFVDKYNTFINDSFEAYTFLALFNLLYPYVIYILMYFLLNVLYMFDVLSLEMLLVLLLLFLLIHLMTILIYLLILYFFSY